MSPITQDMLMAYADGQLDGAERDAVAAHLRAHPDAAIEVSLLQRQNDAIQTLFAPVGAEPVPARLRVRRLAAEGGQRNLRWLGWAAAAMLLVGIGLGAGWLIRPMVDARPASQTLIAD